MDPLGPASAASKKTVFDAGPRPATPKRQPHRLAWRKRRTFPQSTSEEGFTTDSLTAQSAQESTGVPLREEAEFDSAETTRGIFIDLQKSYIQNCATESVLTYPKLDDLIRYGLVEAQQAALWQLETERLAAAIERGFPQDPFISATNDQCLPDLTGFELLSTVAGDALRNIEICDFDNKFECQHIPSRSEETPLPRAEISEDRRADTSGGKVAETSETTITISAAQKRRFYCFLVDYVSAVVAICANYDALDNAVWATSLARCTAKMKFLVIDTEGFASQSLVNGHRLFALGSMRIDKIETANFAEYFSASTGALEILRSLFQSLKCESSPGISNNAFNMGNVVYRTWRGVPIMLSQDQFGSVCGTSIRSDLRYVHGIHHILYEMTRNHPVRHSPNISHPRSSMHASVDLSIPSGHYSNCKAHKRLQTMTEVILYMVPLLFMQHIQLPQLNHNSYFVGKSPSNRDCIRSDATLAAVGLQVFFPSTVTSPPPVPSSLFTPSAAQSVEETHDTQKDEMLNEYFLRNLVIEDKAVVLKLRSYVIMTMMVCGILVVGGILAAFLVGERIPGVDPFNIATFAWVLAAFIILVAKAVYVREWPWYDFLRGQLYCGSVSSLSAITGVDEQDILKYLLVNDPYAVLTTRGPFNRFFTRRSEDGFSIDVTMTLRTLRASGIVVMEVETSKGPAVVCLDLRRGADGRTCISNSDGPQEGERLIGCFDFTEDLEDAVDVRLHTLSRSMTWTRVTGIYDDMDKKFR